MVIIGVFGSRVSRTAAEGGVLDLVVLSPDGSATPLSGLREAFRDSPLPKGEGICSRVSGRLALIR